MDRQFVADTQEQAVQLAQEFIDKQDQYAQAHIWGKYEQNGKWYVTVQWYSLD